MVYGRRCMILPLYRRPSKGSFRRGWQGKAHGVARQAGLYREAERRPIEWTDEQGSQLLESGTVLPLKASKRNGGLAVSEEPWKAFQVRHRSMELKRNAVLKTAAHLFVEHGYQKTSMSLLSTRLKITKPALYYYFRNKEEILVACYRSGIAAIESHLEPLDREPGTALAKLQVFVQGYATVILTHEFGRCVAMIDDSELSAETRRGVRDLKRRVDASIRRLVTAGMVDGSIAECNPKLVSFAIAGAINWAGTWYEPGGELAAEEIAEEFMQILTGGLDVGPRAKKR